MEAKESSQQVLERLSEKKKKVYAEYDYYHCNAAGSRSPSSYCFFICI